VHVHLLSSCCAYLFAFSGIVPAVVFVQPYLPENTQLAERGAFLLRPEAYGLQGKWTLDIMTGAQMG
jgi:hypothetical protein